MRLCQRLFLQYFGDGIYPHQKSVTDSCFGINLQYFSDIACKVVVKNIKIETHSYGLQA